MSKIYIKINKDLQVDVDSDHKNDQCEKSKVMNSLLEYYQKYGEIENIKLKYKETIKNDNIIQIEDLI